MADRLAVHYSSVKQDWGTPWDFFNKLNDEFGFGVDVCATPINAKVNRYFTPEDDGLEQSWAGMVCWMNPPYGRQIKRWIAKAASEARKGATVVALVPARTDTSWWHDYIWDTDNHRPRPGVEVRFVRGRIRYQGAKDDAQFPNAVVVFRKAESE